MATWALDLDGVIWTGSRPIAGSAEAVADLRRAGHDVVFVTNNSAAPIGMQEAKLGRFGIDAAGSVVSSAQAAASLVEAGERVAILGGPGVVEAVEARGAEIVPLERLLPSSSAPPDVDAVLVGLDRDLSYERLGAAAAAIRRGARFVATNGDVTYPSEHGLLPGAGSIVASVEATTGVEPTWAGKPHGPMADLVRDRFGDEGVMVGDRPDTDGEFAVALGYRFALVLSGVTTEPDGVEPSPDHVAADLATVVRDLV